MKKFLALVLAAFALCANAKQVYQDTVTDSYGNVQRGTSVTILTSAGATATIYQSDGVATKANPLTTDTLGGYSFSAANGHYTVRVTISGVNYDQSVYLFDPSDSTASGDINHISAGSNAATRTVQAKLREVAVSVNDFSGSDGCAQANNAITYLKSIGGGVVQFPPGTYNCSTTILVDQSNIFLNGLGADQSHDVGANPGAYATTILKWTGAAGGTMMQFISPSGAANQKQVGGGVSGVYFNANSLAAIGLDIESWSHGRFEDLFFREFSTSAINMNVVAALGEARDPQGNIFRHIGFRHFTQSGAAITMDGDATANTSLNIFERLEIAYKDGDGLVFLNSDNNAVYESRANRAGGGVGNPAVFHGNNTAADRVARANQFYHWLSGVAVVAKGTASYTYPSYDNVFYANDAENATPAPTVEAGATAYYSDNSWFWASPALTSVGIGDSRTPARTARAAITSESLRVYNGGSNHVRLYDGTNEWGLNIDTATGNLRVTRHAGTGTISLVQSVSSTGAITSSSPTSGVGYTTGAGGTITQITSRTTGVILNKVSGAITLFSAAGSTSPTTFTVTDSAVAATDTPVCVQKSGTDKYHVLTTAVTAGTFDVTFYTTGGTTVEQPVFNCNVIKGAAS